MGNGHKDEGLRPGYELTDTEKIGKIYDALRGDISGRPGIFEQLRVLDLRIKIVAFIALLALLFNNPLAQEIVKLWMATGK